MLDPKSQPSNKPINDWGYAGFDRKSLNHDGRRRGFNGGGGGGGEAGDHFRLDTTEEDSGVCSPPLWRSISPPASPRTHHGNPRSYLSPTSRAQAIARGQQELMEMVSHMPETSYELSLKDIVDQRRDVSVDETETQSFEEGEERSILGGSQKWKNKNKKKGSVKRQESTKKAKIMMKNGSFDHNKGVFINMVFPFSFGSRKNSSSRSSSSVNGDHTHGTKVPPKPELSHKSSNHGAAAAATGGGGGDRREWLWRRFTVSSDNESLGLTDSSSGGTTDRSGSSGSSAGGSVRSNSARKTRGCISACWPFFPSRKKKS